MTLSIIILTTYPLFDAAASLNITKYKPIDALAIIALIIPRVFDGELSPPNCEEKMMIMAAKQMTDAIIVRNGTVSLKII